ncbi:MAG: lysophospholipid acyltransferase family protein [Candidatus Schekmanbacteria bacterium]|nr:lysophospholipid acyltransferase family protein [Candidatus Schekmanbacteria bacterium]
MQTRQRGSLARRVSHVGLDVLLGLGDLLGRLPPGWGYAMSRGLGLAVFHLARAERRKAMSHIAIAFPELSVSEHEAILRRCCQHLSWSGLEFAHLVHGGKDWVNSRIRVDGEQHVYAALAIGRGALYITGHIGNWEIQCAWAAQRMPLYPIARENASSGVTRRFLQVREHFGARSLLRERDQKTSVVRAAVEILSAGGVVGILMDQDLGGRGEFVPFFGKLAHTPGGPALLALMTGAPVLFGFSYREGRDRRGSFHRVVYYPPYFAHPGIEPAEAQARGLADPPTPLLASRPEAAQVAPEDIHRYTAFFTATIENAIRKAPEQWVWMHRRWRRQPSQHSPEATGPEAAPLAAAPTQTDQPEGR